MQICKKLLFSFATLSLVAASWTRCAVADDAEQLELALSDVDRSHWAFTPLASPKPPATGNSEWPRNAIDQFVLRRLDENDLQPAPEADRRTLIRRVTFDLTGLPPTVEETQKFLADDRSDAYEQLVDRLLASKAYGVRWAQHWLDLARYAETEGFEHDNLRPNAWRYRDWVIKALNDDMPYGEFVRQQIAGDLLYPEDYDAAIATGFALCGPDMTDINLVAERRHMVLNDITSTVGSVMLGLQMGCAECHDHMYDPVSQADFYRLRAFFEPALHFPKSSYEDENEAITKTASVEKPFEGRILFEAKEPRAIEAFFYHRGDFRSQGPKVAPGFPRIAVLPGESSYPSEPTRAALAEWLTRPDNYLASRVIVNRLWQFHIGHGLVRSSSDFGTMGEEPSHPELLDWLAGQLHREQGSLKQMHRLIVTSATYRQASHLDEADQARLANWEQATEQDPENRLLWRANRRRLEGEAIRDAMLAAAERLSDRSGGVGVRPPLPRELRVTLRRKSWKVAPNEEDHRRRSIYLFVQRNLRYPMFDVFDRPDTNASCPRRAQSTIAPQALVLLNSQFSLEQATELAKLAASEAEGDLRESIRIIHERTLTRPPSTEQLDRALKFVESRAESSASSGGSAEFEKPATGLHGVDQHQLAALTYFSLATFNLNEFVYID
ncbi:DUF1549 and DUF1553 domain-containing protein [Aeoliella sp.]|uniref:DUF1549 and DUF1553 domain-containing protein n=1 Tax=Aeoliella sp. TaxID=2795800 RepID=UPI003CCC178E